MTARGKIDGGVDGMRERIAFDKSTHKRRFRGLIAAKAVEWR